MADDVDPSQSLTTEPGAVDEFGASEASPARVESMEIAMVEIEVVEFETIQGGPEPETEATGDAGPETESEPQQEDREFEEIEEIDDVLPPSAEPLVMTDDSPAAEPEPSPGSVDPVDPLPTMADLDRVASELDDIDARLASLDEQRP